MASGETEFMFPFLQELCLGGFMLEGGGGTHQQQHHNPQSPDMDSLLHYRFENNISFDDEQYCNTYYYGTEPHISMITSPQENLVGQPHSISDYDLGAEGDLFKAPEPVLEERISPMLNPLTTALSMISCGEDQSRKDENHLNHNAASTMEDINGGGATDHLLFSDVYYDCKKDLLENTVIEDTFPELADIKFPALDMGEDHHRHVEISDTVEGPMQKSVSYQSLANTDGGGGGRRGIKNPSFVDFQEMDLSAAYKLRRAHSEGDIKALGNVKTEGMGLVAREDLGKKEVVVEVPKSLWINSDFVMASGIGYVCGGLKPWVSISLFLLSEKGKGGESDWKPYLDVLPEFTDSPLFWSEEELLEIKGTQLLQATLSLKEYIKSEFQKVEDIIFPNKHLFPSSISLTDFFWAFGILRSRAFPRLGDYSLSLIPLADFLNHGPGIKTGGCPWEIGTKGVFSRKPFFSLKTPVYVKAGDQVFCS